MLSSPPRMPFTQASPALMPFTPPLGLVVGENMVHTKSREAGR